MKYTESLIGGAERMRLMRVSDLRPDMIVGKSILNKKGVFLLTAGTKLHSPLIASLQKANIDSIFIDDEISKDIEVNNVLSEQFKHEGVQKIRKFFAKIESNQHAYDLKRVSQSNAEINDMLNDLLDQLTSDQVVVISLNDLHAYDDYTYQHSMNVSILATVVGAALNYSRSHLFQLARSALFHDIGKTFIDRAIINKPVPLNSDEWAEIYKHPQLGFNFAKNVLGFSGKALVGIIHHHERHDGAGYPSGLKGDAIHKNAQIISVVDTFDALISKRSYRDPSKSSEAVEYIMANAGTRFAGDVVAAFLRRVAAYPVGTTVLLSNGMRGIVSSNREGMTLRPTVKIIPPVLSPTSGTTVRDDIYLDLSKPQNASITVIGEE